MPNKKEEQQRKTHNIRVRLDAAQYDLIQNAASSESVSRNTSDVRPFTGKWRSIIISWQISRSWRNLRRNSLRSEIT